MAEKVVVVVDDPLADFDITVSGSQEHDLFEGSLNLEQQCYDQGFQEGVNTPDLDAQHDGKLLGIQTGFQKFLFVGVLTQLIKHLLAKCQTHIDNNDSCDEKGKPRNFEKVKTSLQTVNDTLDSVFFQNGALCVTNDPDSVDLYERTLKNARGKITTLCTQLNCLKLFNDLDRASQTAIGKTPDNHITGDDTDLW